MNKWQLHTSTHVAHAFPKDAAPGSRSLCNRETKTTGFLVDKPGVLPCSRCLKKLEQEAAPS